MRFPESEPQRTHALNYIRELQELNRHEVKETKDRILGYLFGLNAGGLVAGAAYFSQKDFNGGVLAAICLFALGLLSAVIRATLDYYACERVGKSLESDMRKVIGGQMEWEEFLAARNEVTVVQWPFHGLGFISGICFFLGLIIGVIGILC